MPAAVGSPLRSQTPAAWAQAALADLTALLADQAWLEKKAAVNALELLQRWPEPECPAGWLPALAGVAQEETQHLQGVLRLLRERGGQPPRQHANPYARALREQVRAGAGNQELLDRLLVSALIEARSCERLELLAEYCADAELARYWAGLGAAERGHFAVFLRLAADTAGAAERDIRLAQLAAAEARILAVQEPGPRIHSGAPAP